MKTAFLNDTGTDSQPENKNKQMFDWQRTHRHTLAQAHRLMTPVWTAATDIKYLGGKQASMSQWDSLDALRSSTSSSLSLSAHTSCFHRFRGHCIACLDFLETYHNLNLTLPMHKVFTTQPIYLHKVFFLVPKTRFDSKQLCLPVFPIVFQQVHVIYGISGPTWGSPPPPPCTSDGSIIIKCLNHPY